jgi:hypothetical protein
VSRTTSNSGKRRTPRRRNFKDEYQRRLAKGIAAGKSRSASRGHPRAADLPKPSPGPIDRTSPMEKALARMRRGETQSAAAKALGVSVEKLRRHRLMHTTAVREHGRWVIFDTRPQTLFIASRGKQYKVTIPNDESSIIGRYWWGVNNFLASNDPDFIFEFEGEGVRDIAGRFHQFETRPNTLRRMDAIGELHFTEIYADVAK